MWICFRCLYTFWEVPVAHSTNVLEPGTSRCGSPCWGSVSPRSPRSPFPRGSVPSFPHPGGSVPLLAQQLSTPRFHCSAAPGGRLPPAPTEQPWAGAERSRSCRTPAVQFPSPLKHKKSFAMGSRTAKPDLSLFSFLTLIGVHSKLNL